MASPSGLLGAGLLGAGLLGGAGNLTATAQDVWVADGFATLVIAQQQSRQFVGNGLVGNLFVGGLGAEPALAASDHWVHAGNATLSLAPILTLASADNWVTDGTVTLVVAEAFAASDNWVWDGSVRMTSHASIERAWITRRWLAEIADSEWTARLTQ